MDYKVVIQYSNEMQIDIFIPKGYGEKINIDSSSGTVKSDSLKLKELNINTFSGDIELEDVAANSVSFETSSANISVENIEADDIKINTFSGNSEFISLNADKLLFESSSGNVLIRLIEGSEFALEASSSSGNVSCEFPVITTEEQDQNEIKGVVGKDTNKIKIDTFSGDIEINKK